MCGEQQVPQPRNVPILGSPPRVRGTAMEIDGKEESRGITPACAGNRRTFPGHSAKKRDHPRVCGEQLIFHVFLLW